MPQYEPQMDYAAYRESLVRNIEQGGFLLFKALIFGALVFFVSAAVSQDVRAVALSGLAFFAAFFAVFLQYLAAQGYHAHANGEPDWTRHVASVFYMGAFVLGFVAFGLLVTAFLRLIGGVA